MMLRHIHRPVCWYIHHTRHRTSRYSPILMLPQAQVTRPMYLTFCLSARYSSIHSTRTVKLELLSRSYHGCMKPTKTDIHHTFRHDSLLMSSNHVSSTSLSFRSASTSKGVKNVPGCYPQITTEISQSVQSVIAFDIHQNFASWVKLTHDLVVEDWCETCLLEQPSFAFDHVLYMNQITSFIATLPQADVYLLEKKIHRIRNLESANAAISSQTLEAVFVSLLNTHKSYANAVKEGGGGSNFHNGVYERSSGDVTNDKADVFGFKDDNPVHENVSESNIVDNQVFKGDMSHKMGSNRNISEVNNKAVNDRYTNVANEGFISVDNTTVTDSINANKRKFDTSTKHTSRIGNVNLEGEFQKHSENIDLFSGIENDQVTNDVADGYYKSLNQPSSEILHCDNFVYYIKPSIMAKYFNLTVGGEKVACCDIVMENLSCKDEKFGEFRKSDESHAYENQFSGLTIPENLREEFMGLKDRYVRNRMANCLLQAVAFMKCVIHC